MSQVVSERNVRVKTVSEGSALEEVGTIDTSPVPCEPMKFEQNTYQNFHVEYAADDGNLVVHFFVHPDTIRTWPEVAVESWWQNAFASTLSDVAQDYFKATVPRIMAKYTMETASWWFKARGTVTYSTPLVFFTPFSCGLTEVFRALTGVLLLVQGPRLHCKAETILLVVETRSFPTAPLQVTPYETVYMFAGAGGKLLAHTDT